MNYINEKKFLDGVASTYKTAESEMSKWSIDSYLRIYQRFIDKNSGKGLELGCSSGYSTMRLSEMLNRLDVVDGSKKMLDSLPDKIKNCSNVKFIYSLFEEFTCDEQYDYIFCSYVLEHVTNPAVILDIGYKALKPLGKLFITVPNAQALSRQMALEMGLIHDLYTLTENDIAHGHRRVFDMISLKNLLEGSLFSNILEVGGTFVKQFADFQFNQMIEKEIIGKMQLMGMQKIARKYPELSGSIYAVCQKE